MNGAIKAAVQAPPKIEIGGVLNKNTGFPEPLSPYSNTTLPHPSADTSPNACIESADVPISRTHSRHPSLQLRHRPKAKGPLSSGLIASADALPDGIPWADGSSGRTSAEDVVRSPSPAPAAAAAAAEPEARVEQDESEEVQGAEKQRDDQGYREGERKKGVLRKLQLHKV